MAAKYRKDLKLIVHPYLFVLKEGKKIQDNFLDYSLLMLQVASPEILKSPLHIEQQQMMSESDQDLFSGIEAPSWLKL